MWAKPGKDSDELTYISGKADFLSGLFMAAGLKALGIDSVLNSNRIGVQPFTNELLAERSRNGVDPLGAPVKDLSLQESFRLQFLRSKLAVLAVQNRGTLSS